MPSLALSTKRKHSKTVLALAQRQHIITLPHHTKIKKQCMGPAMWIMTMSNAKLAPCAKQFP